MRLGKRLLGMDVFVLSTGRNLGQVQDLIFSVSSSKLMALLVTAKDLVDGEGSLWSLSSSSMMCIGWVAMQ